MHDFEHFFLHTDHMVAASEFFVRRRGSHSCWLVFLCVLGHVACSPCNTVRAPWITFFQPSPSAAARYLYFFVRCLRTTLFCWVLCALGVAPVRYFYIEFPAVELLRAPLPSRPVCFMLCVLGVGCVRYFYIISSSLNSCASSSSALGAPARFLPPTGLSLRVCV